MKTYTKEQKKRITAALIESIEKREKELSYSPDLQHRDMIAFYDQHIEKLNTMLSV